MGRMTIDSWRRLEALIKVHGEDDVLHMICEQIVDAGDITEIAEREGIKERVIWKWLNDKEHPERMAEYDLSIAWKGEKAAHVMLKIADSAVPETVGVSKLQVDTREKLIKKWNKERYGDKVEVTHRAVPVLNIVTALALEEKVIEAEPELLEVEDASPIDG